MKWPVENPVAYMRGDQQYQTPNSKAVNSYSSTSFGGVSLYLHPCLCVRERERIH